MVIAGILMVLSFFADVLASDLPISCKVHGQTYVLPSLTRPVELTEQPWGTLEKSADWLLPPLVRHGPVLRKGEVRAPLLPPSLGSGHPLGTDRQGRDVFARIVHGTRSYLLFALTAVLASMALGVALGALAGVFGGSIDALLTRAVESISAFPPLVLVLGIQAAVPRPSAFTLFFAIALTRWPEIARLVRGEVLYAMTRDYVIAARALGASPLRVLRRHVAPNVLGPLIVAGSTGVSSVVLTEASLDFLRVGLPEGVASWGQTMSEFRDAQHAWWLVAFPGLLLVTTIVTFTFLGEALRNAVDARAR
jgi:peptide/nickel transport system permease protein